MKLVKRSFKKSKRNKDTAIQKRTMESYILYSEESFTVRSITELLNLKIQNSASIIKEFENDNKISVCGIEKCKTTGHKVKRFKATKDIELKRTTIDFPIEVVTALKIYAYCKGESMRQVVTNLVIKDLMEA